MDGSTPIRNLSRLRQPVDFGGIAYGNMMPTDIDGLIEYRDRVFVFYELKLRGTPMPTGQRVALCNIVDNIRANGKYAVLLKCEHDEYDTGSPVDAARAEVTAIYWDGRWSRVSGRTAREVTDSYFAYLMEKFSADTPLGGAF